MRTMNFIKNPVFTFTLGVFLAVIAVKALVNQGIQQYKAKQDASMLAFDQGRLEFFQTETPEQLMERLAAFYVSKEEMRERFELVSPTSELLELHTMRETLRFALDRKMPIDVYSSLGNLSDFPMTTLPEIDYSHERREHFLATTAFSEEQSAQTKVETETAEKIYVEQIEEFVQANREQFDTWPKDRQLAYVNLVHIALRYRAIGTLGYRCGTENHLRDHENVLESLESLVL